MSDSNLTPWQKYKQNLGDTRPWDMLKADNKTTEEKAEFRYNICKSCPELIKLTSQCKKCGCIMSLKTKLEAATCPVGKW
jgi:hypothetical protein